ncbi:hypothetical protein J6590_102627, partial [Homalodisca vitripennis]
MVSKPAMNLWQYPAIPRNDRTFVTVLGTGKSRTAGPYSDVNAKGWSSLCANSLSYLRRLDFTRSLSSRE